MNRYKELNVWKKSIDLVVEMYNTTSQFPDSEKFGLISQINRAAVSIPSNIAEGAGRKSEKEFANFLSYSNGSSSELETQLIISEKLKYINKGELSKLSKEINDIQNMIFGFKEKFDINNIVLRTSDIILHKMSIIEIKIPNVGESVTEATVGEWYKNDGDFVELDEIIVELETDKATQEFPAEAAGTLKIMAQEGDTVLIGQVIAQIDTSAAPTAKTETATPSAAQAATAPQPTAAVETPRATGQVVEMNVPAVGESITEVTIGSWIKEDGDIVAMDEILCEIESDKATFELTSESQGKLVIVAQEGDTLEIGAPICKIEVMEGNIGSAAPTPAATQSATAPPSNPTHGATPVAANILADKGISAQEVSGSGANGKVMKADALQAQKTAPQAQPAAADSPAFTVPGARNEERKKMTPLRKTIARRLVAVKNKTAMLTTFNEVDMKPIMDIRKKYKESFKEKYEVGLGFMSFFTKAVCEAMKAWPAVGAQIDGEEIVYHDYCDVSIAVSAPKGLVVPVIRNAESMSFDQIEKEVVRLAVKARDGKLSMDEMTGGTFTITNGGIFGSMLSTPIINAPQAAILGMHNIVERPVAINGQVEIRPIMYVALSYDHRIIDGKESVSFLKMVKELLEDPTRLLLGI